MLGAIIGDITGSPREFDPWKLDSKTEVEILPKDGFFTDDTVLTCAVAKATMDWLEQPPERQTEQEYKTRLVREMQEFGRNFPKRGYGGRFLEWIHSEDPQPYNSWGNGSAMRVSAISFLARNRRECRRLARWSAEVTHNHPDGIRGAVCTAELGYLARKKKDKEYLRAEAAKFFPELADEGFTVDCLYETYRFTERCKATVPQAVECVLEAESYAEAITNCIYIGGDCDTTAAIAGGIAEALFGGADEFSVPVCVKLLQDINGERLLHTISRFYNVVEMTARRRLHVVQKEAGIPWYDMFKLPPPPLPFIREWKAQNAELDLVKELHEGLEELYPDIWRRFIPEELVKCMRVLGQDDAEGARAWEVLEPLRRSVANSLRRDGYEIPDEETPEYREGMTDFMKRSIDLYQDIIFSPYNKTDDLSVLT